MWTAYVAYGEGRMLFWLMPETIFKEIMQPIMYESPTLRDEKGISKIVITEKTVKEKAEPEYIA